MSPIMTAPAPCPAHLNAEQIAQYERDGYIAFADVLSMQEIEAAKASLRGLVDRLREHHRTLKNGEGEMWADPGGRQKIQFQKGAIPTDSDDPTAYDKVRKYHDFVGVDENLAFLACQQAKIQGVLAALIGPDPILTQDMALMNPPHIGTGKPWHQDDAYFKIAPLEAVCGVWIALDEAGIDNGCMHFLPGRQRQGALRHFHGSDCEIIPEHLRDAAPVAVPLPAGGAVFFCGIAPHMTMPNTSNERRRALQFHFRALDSRVVSDEEYNQIFVEADGTPASCAAAAARGF